MKWLLVLAWILLPAVAISAQSGSPSPDASPQLSVLKFSWSKERVGWERDPFGGPIENFDEMRVRARNEKRILDAKKGGNSAEVDKLARDARSDDALISEIHKNTEARYGFLYKTSVQNTGAKIIKTIDWDYVFFDTNTQAEMGRRQFTSDEQIGPGKTRELKFFIAGPPTRTISVSSLNKNERDRLGEAVVIVRIEYADGSSWQHPQQTP
ncbi:MAG TPA: hypothetical protein VJ372_09025 [Pyrinomonadaceae bacterium]|jgi:hypothetical protein|nr:hypothetical protein [Pyrinomonadaceae bacterium]